MKSICLDCFCPQGHFFLRRVISFISSINVKLCSVCTLYKYFVLFPLNSLGRSSTFFFTKMYEKKIKKSLSSFLEIDFLSDANRCNLIKRRQPSWPRRSKLSLAFRRLRYSNNNSKMYSVTSAPGCHGRHLFALDGRAASSMWCAGGALGWRLQLSNPPSWKVMPSLTDWQQTDRTQLWRPVVGSVAALWWIASLDWLRCYRMILTQDCSVSVSPVSTGWKKK